MANEARRGLDGSVPDDLMRAMAERSPIGFCLTDGEGNVLSVNQRMIDIVGSDPTGQNLVALLVPEDVDATVAMAVAAFHESRNTYQMQVRFRRPDGSVRHADVHCETQLDSHGEIDGIVLGVIDNTDAFLARLESDRFALLLADLTDFVALCDPAGRVTYLNRVAEISAREIPMIGARRLADFFDAPSRGRLAAEGWPEVSTHGFWQGELTLSCAPGVTSAVSVSLTAHEHIGGEQTVSVVARDISDMKAAQRALEIQATHDVLTGLPNRALMFDRVTHALDRSQRATELVALMFVDLDGFKAINDDFGHDVGDEVLRGVSTRLVDCVRAGDTVARIGGDEFVILTENLADETIALEIADRILRQMTVPFAVGSSIATIGASIGVAFATSKSTVAGLVKQADLAVYEAKRAGRSRYMIFSDAPQQSLRHSA